MSVDAPLRYGGFWVRGAALVPDLLINLPLIAFIIWAGPRYRLFQAYFFIPWTLIALFYNVYLVRRFGGTPGKLIMRLRIRKTTGEPVGYREAVLREGPNAFAARERSLFKLDGFKPSSPRAEPGCHSWVARCWSGGAQSPPLF
jgi:uncharacterized RDD family membrane protein YckC